MRTLLTEAGEPMAQKSCMAQPVGRWLLHATSQIQPDCKGQQCAHSLEPGGNIGRKTPRIWISLLPSLSTLLSHLPFFLYSMPFLSFSGVLTGLDVLMCVTLKRRKRPPNRQMSESPASVTVCSQSDLDPPAIAHGVQTGIVCKHTTLT